MQTHTNEVIGAAIEGLEAKKQHIDAQIEELRAMLAGSPSRESRGSKRKFSAETIRRMREGQRRRWAKVRGESTAGQARSKPKRKLSAAARKAISEAAKKRWALKRA
jgi:hypothetical protein